MTSTLQQTETADRIRGPERALRQAGDVAVTTTRSNPLHNQARVSYQADYRYIACCTRLFYTDVCIVCQISSRIIFRIDMLIFKGGVAASL